MSSTGSKPRWASSGTWSASASGVVTNSSPNVRGSTKRSSPPWVKVITAWVCLGSGSRTPPLPRSSWPLMPRWTTSTSPPSSRRSRYLPRRSTPMILWPSSRATKSALSGWRRMVRSPSTATDLMRRPTTSLSRSRLRVSTSGSSGIGIEVLRRIRRRGSSSARSERRLAEGAGSIGQLVHHQDRDRLRQGRARPCGPRPARPASSTGPRPTPYSLPPTDTRAVNRLAWSGPSDDTR